MDSVYNSFAKYFDADFFFGRSALQNYLSEILSIILTIFVVDQVIRFRHKRINRPLKNIGYVRLIDAIDDFIEDFIPPEFYEPAKTKTIRFGNYHTFIRWKLKDFDFHKLRQGVHQNEHAKEASAKLFEKGSEQYDDTVTHLNERVKMLKLFENRLQFIIENYSMHFTAKEVQLLNEICFEINQHFLIKKAKNYSADEADRLRLSYVVPEVAERAIRLWKLLSSAATKNYSKLSKTAKTPILIFCLALSCAVNAQYQPNWQSLDTRATPQWFKDAKFGIFIHWGVYSVPGWSSKGQYAEWYQYGLQTNDTARQRFHKTKFGDRTYYDLAKDFKAELFNPDEWAKLFEQSGAKYIVLTSKHHDGYALWPSENANKIWGFPWNAASVGPNRDLLGDLFKAVRKTNVRAGMYYSLYEWFNPLWKSDPKKFAAEHTWPQMKELINKYEPDVFWTDGDWDVTAETWKSQEFLAWLFNESAVKNSVVVNDRWGSGVRFKHGGIFTPEYQPDLGFEDHYWEESRGMGHSYGYNREEDAWDYNSTESLVMQLVDKASRGGNFLLDIGPDEHGKIPPIMQERLLQIGEWLKINGSAIYGTVKWKESRQGEVYFTYNADSNNLYAIFSKYPSSRRIELNNIQLPAGCEVELLSTKQRLRWEIRSTNTFITFPEYDPNLFKVPYAYAIKIANYGKFLKKPVINIAYNGLIPQITITSPGSSMVFYTIDGDEPNDHSMVYTKPFALNKTLQLKVKAFSANDLPSATAVEKIIRYEWMPAVKSPTVNPGIAYKYYEPSGKIDMKVFENGGVIKTGIASVISRNEKQRADKYALLFEGFIKIDKDGAYNFFTSSDDGSKLFIDDAEIVDNDGDHGTVEKSGKAFLRKGYHKIKVQYFDSGGGNELKIHMQMEGGKKIEIPASVLYH